MIQISNQIQTLALASSAVAVGGYDGFHLGHRTLLDAMISHARVEGIPTVIVTFHPLPFAFFQRSSEPRTIVLPEEKAFLADKIGIDYLITLKFDQELADVPGEKFVQQMVRHLGMESLWVGEDFSLGRHRDSGSQALAELSRKYDFKLHVVQQIKLDSAVISSTRIRSLISGGIMGEAAKLLGYPYFFIEKVVSGDGRGRKLGVPTYNMNFPPEKIRPPLGVYAAYLWMGGVRYDAVTSIGCRPTFYDHGNVVVETFVLGEPVDPGDENVKVEFIEYLRPEYKFDSAEELVNQIHRDVEATKKILKKLNKDKSD